MELAADGGFVRSEASAKQVLLQMGLQVMPADTFLRNDCLIDSMLQSLMHANLIHSTVSSEQRNAITRRVRQHLRDRGRTGVGYDYLSHDEHSRSIFEYLLLHEETIWIDRLHVHDTEITITVYDRFQGRRLVDVHGNVNELPECEPILIEATVSPPINHVQLFLYCCTHGDGSGYHYEWVRPASSENFPTSSNVREVTESNSMDIPTPQNLSSSPEVTEAPASPAASKIICEPIFWKELGLSRLSSPQNFSISADVLEATESNSMDIPTTQHISSSSDLPEDTARLTPSNIIHEPIFWKELGLLRPASSQNFSTSANVVEATKSNFTDIPSTRNFSSSPIFTRSHDKPNTIKHYTRTLFLERARPFASVQFPKAFYLCGCAQGDGK